LKLPRVDVSKFKFPAATTARGYPVRANKRMAKISRTKNPEGPKDLIGGSKAASAIELTSRRAESLDSEQFRSARGTCHRVGGRLRVRRTDG
jgi:hypothetical protein